MKRASYRDSIKWIVRNDDITDINDLNHTTTVSMALVADIFGVEDDKVLKDVRREAEKPRKHKVEIE